MDHVCVCVCVCVCMCVSGVEVRVCVFMCSCVYGRPDLGWPRVYLGDKVWVAFLVNDGI